MCSELPKEFEVTTEVLPFTKYGLSSIKEFKKIEEDIQYLEWLKRAGLSSEEIKLHQENESGLLDKQKKIESNALKEKLDAIYTKIKNYTKNESAKYQDEPSTSKSEIFDEKPINIYPEQHPMNHIKEIEDELFGHLKNDNLAITKRRKILRHLERRKERIISQEKQSIDVAPMCAPIKPGSLWDVKEVPEKRCKVNVDKEPVIGPKMRTMYTVRDNRIVRLEPGDGVNGDEYRAVDIVVPANAAEAQLLEGTKMSTDDIKKIERFKDYEPGIPSKVLYLKNISPSVTPEQLSLLFNQFVLDNGGPVDVRLMTGRMRGQAFVAFHNEETAIQALEEVNGTILSGRPIVAQFGRNTNRIQLDER